MNFLVIHIFFLCINIGFGTVEYSTGFDLGSIDNEDYSDLIDDISEPNGDDGVLDWLTDTYAQAGASTKLIINAITGGFIIDFIDSVVPNLPDIFIIGVKSVILFMLAIQVFVLFSGRIITKLS